MPYYLDSVTSGTLALIELDLPKGGKFWRSVRTRCVLARSALLGRRGLCGTPWYVHPETRRYSTIASAYNLRFGAAEAHVDEPVRFTRRRMSAGCPLSLASVSTLV